MVSMKAGNSIYNCSKLARPEMTILLQNMINGCVCMCTYTRTQTHTQCVYKKKIHSQKLGWLGFMVEETYSRQLIKSKRERCFCLATWFHIRSIVTFFFCLLPLLIYFTPLLLFSSFRLLDFILPLFPSLAFKPAISDQLFCLFYV